jgi:hypothetical protein
MARRLVIVALTSAVALLGVATLGATRASAASPISLLLPQSTAFSILGRSCGGIQEQAYATGFDPASGYPTGDVDLTTRCGGSGRGGGYHTTTYTAWAAVTWDFTGAVVSSSVLTSAPAVDPALTAFDANGNEVANVSGQALLTLAASFTPAPRVIGISVTSGPASGGTSVTITGTGFTAATAVNFGMDAAASFVIGSDTSITAVSPAADPATVDITVASAGGFSATGPDDLFTLIGVPSVTGLSPSSGPVAGGTPVTVSGQNLAWVTSVAFGDTPAGFTVNGDGTITAFAPPGETPDTVSVRVTSLGGTSAGSSADVFTYTAPPHLAVAPASGLPNTSVTVSGAGFLAGETVKVSYKTGLAAPSPSAVTVCTTTAAADGTFSCSGHIPTAGLAGAIGTHNLKAKGLSTLVTEAGSFKLT